LFGNNLHAGMLADGVNPTLAGAAAVLGTVGVEISGALACSMAVMSYHKRDYKIMAVSIGAAMIYAVFVMVGISQSRNTGTFAAAVIISLIAYLMQGVWTSYNERLRSSRIETDMQIDSMEAQRKLTNSQVRLAKAESGNIPKVSESFGNSRFTDWRHVPAADRARIAGLSTRQISDEYQVSERTAQNWKGNAQRLP
jgi:hypothetical protein